MTAFLRTFFVIVLSCQVFLFGEFVFNDHGFAAEPSEGAKKSSGVWKEAALLDKGVSSGRRFAITWPAVAVNDKGGALAEGKGQCSCYKEEAKQAMIETC